MLITVPWSLAPWMVTKWTPVGRDRYQSRGWGRGWVDVLQIQGKWEGWKSHIQFLKDSLLLRVVSPFIRSQHLGTMRQILRFDLNFLSRKFKEVRSFWSTCAWPLCGPITHPVSQLVQVNGLGPGCPTTCCNLFFSETWNWTMYCWTTRVTVNWRTSECAKRGSVMESPRRLSVAHQTILLQRWVQLLELLWKSELWSNPGSEMPQAAFVCCGFVGSGVESWYLQIPLWLIGWMMAKNVLSFSK